MKTIDLDEGNPDLEVEYTLGGKKFRCFPSDEIDIINGRAEEIGEHALQGEPFLQVIADRLSQKYDVKTTVQKMAKWYSSLHAVTKEQEDFTGGSDASSGSTASDPVKGSSQLRNTSSLKGSKTRSGRKKTSKS